jgi:transcriptional regulator with XRE-family HTH domain
MARHKTFLREWRKNHGPNGERSKTLEAVADHLHMSHSQLSRIERGQQPYNPVSAGRSLPLPTRS